MESRNSMVHCFDCRKHLRKTKACKIPHHENSFILCNYFESILSTHRYCFYCKEVTTFFYCGNCGKMFCSKHAIEEEDGDWESGYHTYITHGACCK